MKRRFRYWMLVALLGLGFAGCQRSDEVTREPMNTPELVAHRKQFQLSDEPTGARPLGEVPGLLAAPASDAETTSEPGTSDVPIARDVVFLARVGGVRPDHMADDQEFPWEPGRAAFVVSDPTTGQSENDQHHHADGNHDDCPFCAKKQAAGPLALVQFLDTHGEALQVDARDLFTIAENDVVVVEGTARMVGATLVVVDAKGIYVRR